MKKKILYLCLSLCFLSGCKDKNQENSLIFGTSPDYPPFEYYDGKEIVGFDIDLARLIAKEMGKKIVFQAAQFSALLPSVENGSIDAGISSIAITEARKKNFDFSESYYADNTEGMSMVYPKDKPIIEKRYIHGKKIACQLGSLMEVWLRENTPDADIITMDTNPQAIEALKAGHVDGVLMDSVQGENFVKRNAKLSKAIVAQTDTGYGIVLKQGSPLREEINDALKTLKNKGEIQKLIQKWLV